MQFTNNLYLFLYFYAYHLATSGVPPVVCVPPVENRCCTVYEHIISYYFIRTIKLLKVKLQMSHTVQTKIHHHHRCHHHQQQQQQHCHYHHHHKDRGLFKRSWTNTGSTFGPNKV